MLYTFDHRHIWNKLLQDGFNKVANVSVTKLSDSIKFSFCPKLSMTTPTIRVWSLVKILLIFELLVKKHVKMIYYMNISNLHDFMQISYDNKLRYDSKIFVYVEYKKMLFYGIASFWWHLLLSLSILQCQCWFSVGIVVSLKNSKE
jgi:hypothetical protein